MSQWRREVYGGNVKESGEEREVRVDEEKNGGGGGKGR